MKFHSLIAIAAAATFAGAVSAQTPPIGQPSQPSTTPSASGAAGGEFDTLDKDRDGSVTKKEAASNKDLTKTWDTLDSNKDGKLDQGEFAQFEAGGSASGSMGGSSGSASGSTSGSTESDKGKTEKPKF